MARINRREFIKLAGLNAAALAFPFHRLQALRSPGHWPALTLQDLHPKIRDILSRVPDTAIDGGGILHLLSANGTSIGQVTQARTQWNIENDQPLDRLSENKTWGIVLHWFGDRGNYEDTVTAYLRGFDSMRQIDDYLTATSAHFLVGDQEPKTESKNGEESIGIIQTQQPAPDGIPYVASHLKDEIEYEAHEARRQYFVKALYQLSYIDPGVHSILQDFYDGPRIDPNRVTIAIEVTGHDFDERENYPSSQKMANVISVVWAVMKRYRIPATNVLGHNEIQLGKPDPGKKFLATVRFLLGVKALLEGDEQMDELVFGQFLDAEEPNHLEAVDKYFAYVRDYLALVGSPSQVYEWETLTRYWFLHDVVFDNDPSGYTVNGFRYPLVGVIDPRKGQFLDPQNHEGVDLYCPQVPPSASFHIRLIANGKCLYADQAPWWAHQGKAAIFLHRLPDGAELLSIYGNLDDFGSISVGESYPQGYRVGKIERQGINGECFLHFAIAYGATWDIDLRTRPYVPPNAGVGWIQNRYLNPIEYLNQQLAYLHAD